MIPTEKTIDKLQAEKSREALLRELAEIREYQATHPSVKKYPGGLVIDFGDNHKHSWIRKHASDAR